MHIKRSFEKLAVGTQQVLRGVTGGNYAGKRREDGVWLRSRDAALGSVHEVLRRTSFWDVSMKWYQAGSSISMVGSRC